MAYTHLWSEKNPNQIIQVESEDEAEHLRTDISSIVRRSIWQYKVIDDQFTNRAIREAFKFFEVNKTPLSIPELHDRVAEARLSTEVARRFVILKAAESLVAHKIPLPLLTSITPVANKVTEKEFDPQAAYERMFAVKQRHRQRPIVPTAELKVIKHFPMPD